MPRSAGAGDRGAGVRGRGGRGPRLGRAEGVRPARRSRRGVAARRGGWPRAATRISMVLPIRSPVVGSGEEAVEQRTRLLERRRPAGSGSGEQHPGEGDVLELADVGQVVVGAEPAARRPSASAASRSPRASCDPGLRSASTGRTGGEKSVCVAAARPRSMQRRVRRRGRRGRGAAGRWRRASGRGAGGGPAARRAPCWCRGGRSAASRSLRSISTSLSPTCMSAAPRRPGCSTVWRSACSKVRWASPEPALGELDVGEGERARP